MKVEMTCRNLCNKLNIDLKVIISYAKNLEIDDSSNISDNYILNDEQIHILIAISGYLKLGMSRQEIEQKILCYSLNSDPNYQQVINSIGEFVPAIIITQDAQDKTVLTSNSLAPSLDIFLASQKKIKIADIAEKLSIKTENIQKILESHKACLTDSSRKVNYAHGSINDRFYHFQITSIKTDNKYGHHLITTVFSDHTDYYLAQKNLSDNNLGFHNIINKVPFPILVLEQDNIIYFNQPALLLFKKENITKYTFSSLLHTFSNNPESVKSILEIKNKFTNNNEKCLLLEKIEFELADKYQIFNVNFSRMVDNLILVGFSDITEREKHLGNLLLERNLFENGPVMVMKCINRDKDKKIEWISENVKHFTGYTKKEIIEQNIDINNLVSPDMLPDLFKEADHFYEQKKEFYSHSPYKMIRRDGSEIWVKDHTRLLYDTNKNFVGYLEYLIDVSEMKKAQDDLNKAKVKAEDASRAKSTFLSHISHEIRTPLNAINGFSQLIYDTEKDLDKRDKIRTIVQSGNHLLDIINNILELSKIESGNIELNKKEFSLNNLMDEVQRIIAISAQSKSLEFNIVKSFIVPNSVIGDQSQLKQILINLLTNAVNYTEKGYISLELKYQSGWATFIVSDTGIGISKDKLKDIFSAFEQIRTTNKNVVYGTGLGLSIVKRIVDAMEGEIEVDSNIDQGSSFKVSIPLPEIDTKKTSSNISLEKSKVSDINDLSSVKILVAEDNKINQKLIKSIFKKVNNNCDIAENGQVALDMLAEKEYDILLLDMQMPVLDGMETLLRIRQDAQLKDLPIIALTAYAMSEEKDKYLAAGCNDFVAKPINRNELYQKINKIMTDMNETKFLD